MEKVGASRLNAFPTVTVQSSPHPLNLAARLVGLETGRRAYEGTW